MKKGSRSKGKKLVKVAGIVGAVGYLDAAYQFHKGIQPYMAGLSWGASALWPSQVSALKAAVVAGAGSAAPNPAVTSMQLAKLILTGNPAAVAPAAVSSS